MIPTGFLQELLARTDIVDVVGRHVELKRAGGSMMGLCPFHGEKTPSFSVNPARQFYHCFGCNAGGDAIRFLTEHLGLSFIEAVRDLAQAAGMQVPEEQVSAEERQRRDTLRQRRLSLTEVLARAAGFYRAQLKASPQAIQYLKQRGLSGTVAARFGLGYAPPGWRTLASVFGAYDDPLLEEAGLVRHRDAAQPGQPASAPDAADAPEPAQAEAPQLAEGARDRGRYDWFRDRIMFPIRAIGGEIIGFGGRVLDNSKPKYMNSPETPVFSKGRELYGLFEARQAVRDKGYALVVEGYMDVVALAQSGLPNAVATLGTACTADHVQKLFRFTDAVVFSFDGDAAGRRAAARALEAALPHATDLRSVRFLFLPPEHDPDSFVREQGTAAFEQAVAQAVPLSRLLLQQAAEGADLDSAEGRARLLAQARPLWTALPEGALRRQLLPELARQARLETADLVALWALGAAQAHADEGGRVPRRSVAAAAAGTGGLAPGQAGRSAPNRAPLRSLGRRPPAALADVALRLLLRHSDWWARLPAPDHDLLHGLGGIHGAAVAWLEQQITEHGDQPWSALQATLLEQPWSDEARRWLQSGDDAEEMRFEDLLRVLNRLQIQRLEQDIQDLIASGQTGRTTLERIQALREQIQGLKSASPATPATP